MQIPIPTPIAEARSASDVRGTPAMRWAQSDDVVTHAANLSGWQQQYDQLSGGSFFGQLAEIWFDDVQVFRERTSRALRQICRIRPDAVWCGLTLAPDGSRIEGHQVGAGGVMVSGSDADFELATPDNHDILGIVASRAALESVAKAVGQPLDPGALCRSTWLACDPTSRAQLQRGLGVLLGYATAHGNCHDHVAARRLAQQSVLEALLAVLAGPQSDGRECLSFERRRHLVRQACRYTARQLSAQEVPSVPDLCEHLHVSRRTLQYAFETVVGSSPLVYLRALRLNAARRDLLTGAASSVQEAAGRHGFWSLSQFACDYRQHFAERPSQTLARARIEGHPTTVTGLGPPLPMATVQ